MEGKLLPRIVSNAVSTILHEPLMMAESVAKSMLWYTLDVSDFRWGIRQEVLLKYFKHIPVGVNVTSFHNKNVNVDLAKLPDEYIDFCIFEGTTIWIKYRCVDNKSDPDGALLRLTITLKVVSTNKNRETINRFVKMLVKESRKIERKVVSKNWHKINGVSMFECYNKPQRSFNDVFIPKTQKDRITHTVKKFCESEKWYKDHRIPYHFGILLHGNPGTGKSSIIQVITSLMECEVFYLNTSDLGSSLSNDHWIRYTQKDIMRVIIIEDIDTEEFTHKRETKTANADNMSFSTMKKASLNELLQFIDGYDSPDKVIYIMTTNHVENLDAALIRPGRIDLMEEIGYVNDETFSDFCNFHYGKRPGNTNVRDGITCAELQTRVMSGVSFEELCEYVKKEENKNGKI